jgi:hypothetical protein
MEENNMKLDILLRELDESTVDFLLIQQNIVNMLRKNNPRNLAIKLFENYKKFMNLIKGHEDNDDNVEDYQKKPNIEAAIASLLKRLTGEKIELDLDRYYQTSGRKKSDILSDTKLLEIISKIKSSSTTDEKKLLNPLFQITIKLDEYLSNNEYTLNIDDKQTIVLAVFWMLLIDNKYIPAAEKLSNIAKQYGTTKSFILAKKKAQKILNSMEDEADATS